MSRFKFHMALIGFSLGLIFWFAASSRTVALAQEPQASPTPPASSGGIFVTVLGDEPFANVRLGPSASIYPVIGQLLPGDTAPAIGRSPGGDWVQIEFAGGINNKGWIYSPLVSLSPGTLHVVEPPPTPLPPPTSTIDPTLAAQFSIVPTSTRLPTFTPPAPLATKAAYSTSPDSEAKDSVPLGLIIFTLGSFGVVGLAVSLLLPRRF
ncbi:MAG: SH3 domain-containing protein [Anaerolineales bacterium]|nr:SH3 domain-containing protein [Anaerolineales bacterium]